MPFRDPRSRLVDIADAIGWLREVLEGKDLADYRADRALRDIAERNLEKISEASRHRPPEMKAAHPTIPWPQIAALGNRLRHGYDAIDDELIWQTIRLELPALDQAVTDLLAALDRATIPRS